MKNRTLVIGIGTEERGDDAAGLAVARLLKARAGSSLMVREHTGDVTDLLQVWQGMERVIIVDAVRSGREPGTVYCFEASSRMPSSKLLSCSTHALSIVAALELARVLHEMPPRVVVYGIEAGNFIMGTGLTRQVRRAVKQVADCILREVHVKGSRIITRDSLPDQTGNGHQPTEAVLVGVAEANKP